MAIIKKEFNYAGQKYTLETGRIARQATSSVMLTVGKTSILSTVVVGKKPSEAGFFPLRVDYIEKAYSAGNIPGGFGRREGKLSDREVLISRLIDRPARPMFPEDFLYDVQIVTTVMSLDKSHETDIAAMLASFAALSISGAPMSATIGVARVGYRDGEYILNPSLEDMSTSQLDMVVAGSESAVLMVESEAKELGENIMLDAVMFAHKEMQVAIDAINDFKVQHGSQTMNWTQKKPNDEIVKIITDKFAAEVSRSYEIQDKQERSVALGGIKSNAIASLITDSESCTTTEKEIEQVLFKLSSDVVRKSILQGKPRIDGRDKNTVRPISVEVGVLPSAHGSALFTRGETQALVSVTLASIRESQMLDTIYGEINEWFMFQYNFPPYCVGEIGNLGAPKRREIGHGNLARRGVFATMPKSENFPYSMRVVSEITESNGSSSMASVCGSSLALMDAGIAVSSPVAGIAMGLIKEGNEFVVLTDIMGDEDHLGDMDFKVAGSEAGITALQMDIKIDGISREIMQEALTSAKNGRIHILGKMTEVLAKNRPEMAATAPKIHVEKIDPKKIREVIGKGGSTIQEIIRTTGAEVDISDDGTIRIYADNSSKTNAALATIMSIVAEVEVGKIYQGKVTRITNFGAFVALEGLSKEGLLHISQVSDKFLSSLDGVLEMGQEITVRAASIDDKGRLKLAYKDVEQKK